MRSGVYRMALTWLSGTHSHQTVCQMPLCGVYQMPPRFELCLPRESWLASKSSLTCTMSSLSPGRRKAVRSAEKAV